MEPLEIKDKYNDTILLSIPDLDNNVRISSSDHTGMITIEIKKENAEKIIAHLKQCFNI